jgi:hypothetical protein
VLEAETKNFVRRDVRGKLSRFCFGSRFRDGKGSRRLFVQRKEVMSRVLEINRRNSFSAFHGAI